ncbi:MAG: hypothetical protein LBE57_05755 [Methanosarcinales archaeon]|jgi:predicted acyltransferase (DUF342 family)|nr:hypothetical protein [Methanosarcinales archaeon]
MISSKNIRFHSPSNTYIIPKNSIIDQNVAVKGNVIVGPGVRFWKNVKIDGNIQLGKGCFIEGHLKANQIIVGSRSKIKGNIKADADISLFQNVVVSSIESGGSITIMPGCVVGYANGNTLTVIGKADIRKIGAITKVTVRANTVAEMENEEEYDDGYEEECEDRYENETEDIQTVSEELIFENKISDEIKAKSAESKASENKFGSRTKSLDSHSSSTPTLPMEISDGSNPISIKAITESTAESEEFDAEIIDETNDASPKSFTISAFAGSQAERPVRVPTDESDEVEVVGEADDSGSVSSEYEMVSQTVETPFGTIVVGEKPISKENIKAVPSNNSFATVTKVSKEEQQADYEAEIRAKSGIKAETKSEAKFASVLTPAPVPALAPTSVPTSAPAPAPTSVPVPTPSKSEFRWPAFEPKKMPKAEKQQAPVSKKSAAWPDDEHFSQMKVSSVRVQYEEFKIRNASKPKENLFEQKVLQNNESAIAIGRANRKIVFEEVGYSPAGPAKVQQKSKAEILMEQMNFDAASSKPAEAEMKKNPEKKERSREEIEKSKIWYEKRHPQSESKKKDYPPYV